MYKKESKICGELARRMFFMRPRVPKMGWPHRMRELDDTVPNPRDQRVWMSDAVVVAAMANLRRIARAMRHIPQLWEVSSGIDMEVSLSDLQNI